ncbi:transient receptor potential cation channel subfamily A member 1-like isoform X1 [Lineus longissimus]|uniref:transient receptor potential cation channel subfamily A member 1-like isoform X1 n=1 Tax=Lineus longissimus TaxID=88925 RepID=UPI002B4D943B
MSSDKHEKKHRRKKVTPLDDDADKKFNPNYSYYENPAYGEKDLLDLEKQNNASDILNKFQKAAEKAQYHGNAINLIANVKQGAARWRNYTTSKRTKQKRADTATSDMTAEKDSESRPTTSAEEDTGVDRRCTGGKGLADIEEDFISDSKSTSRQMVVASNRTLLQYFARLGGTSNYDECIDLDFVESLFKNGARIDCTDKYGQTIFHEVARAWHVDVAKFLIENGGDPNVADSYGRTPLHVAAAVDYADMVKFLINNGANKEIRTKGEDQTPVHFAAKNDACQSLKALVKLGCEYKMVRDYKKRTPIQVAAELDRSETAGLLLELGSPVGVQDDSGQPCIVWMISKMAPVAKEALNQFHITDRANRKQYYYLNHLEPKPPKDLDKKTHAQTALEVITCYKQFDLVTHPAVKRLIHVKWKRFGQLGAWSNLIFNFVFICLWTALGVYPDWKERYKYTFPEDSWRIIMWIAAITLTMYQIVSEILEYNNSRKKHLAWKGWREKELDRDKNFCHPRWPEEEEYILQEKDELDKAAPQYASDWWNIFDWVCYVLLLSCIVTHIADVALPVHSVLLAHAHIRIMSVNIILLWLRLMKNARAFSLLGPFIAMLGHILNDVVKFIFLFLEFYIPYFCAFWMTLGGKNTLDHYLYNPPEANSTDIIQIEIPGYGSPTALMFSLWRLTLVDDYPYDEMKSVDPIMTDILVGTWFALSAILCLNLFIALMSDTFQRVYDNAHANAVMQKAMTIMNIQDNNMSRKRRFAFMQYIHENCAPQKETYDDDLTSDKSDDLKKVAFQVKDELEEIKDWFHAKFGPVDVMGDDSGKKVLNQNLTVDILENEVDILRGELRDITATQQDFQEQYVRDMSGLKGLLEQILINQGGGGRGMREAEAVYEDPYQAGRDDDARRSRKRGKKRSSKARRSEITDDFGEPGTTGQGLDLDPMIEVRPMGHVAAEPPPPEMGIGLQESTDA